MAMKCPHCGRRYVTFVEFVQAQMKATGFPPCLHCGTQLVVGNIGRSCLIWAAAMLGIACYVLATACGWPVGRTGILGMVIGGLTGTLLTFFFPTLYYTYTRGAGCANPRVSGEHAQDEGLASAAHVPNWRALACLILACALPVLMLLRGSMAPWLARVTLGAVTLACTWVALYRSFRLRIHPPKIPLFLALTTNAGLILYGSALQDWALVAIGAGGGACWVLLVLRRAA